MKMFIRQFKEPELILHQQKVALTFERLGNYFTFRAIFYSKILEFKREFNLRLKRKSTES